MRKIYNPYDKLKDHTCFACSKKNPIGLKLEFYEDGEEIVADWNPSKEYSGFYNVLHGGIQSVLIDEIGAWCIQIKHKTAGVTAKLETRYKRPVKIDKGNIKLRARITETKRNLVTVYARLFDAGQNLCAEGEAQYFTFPQQYAKEKLYYPEYSEFFNES